MIAEINLLPKKNRKKITGRAYIIVMASLFLVIAIVLTFLFITAKQQRTEAQTELDQLQSHITVLQSEVDSSSNSQNGSRKSAVLFIENVSYPVSPIILEINSFITPNSYLRQFEFSEQTVVVQADFEDKTKIALFVSDLLTSKMFKDVKVDEINAFQLENESSTEEMADFTEMPRYSAQFTLEIDTVYVRSEGVMK